MKPLVSAEIPIDPTLVVPKAARTAEVLAAAAEHIKAGRGGAMATVFARHGSAPSTPGQKLFLGDDGVALGTVGGGAVEREVLRALGAMVRAAREDDKPEAREPRLETFKLGPELAMCCGGRVDILLEPLVASLPCFIVGGGHVAAALGPMLARLGFAVTVADEREGFADDDRIPGVLNVQGEFDDVGSDLPDHTLVLVMTHDHALDQRVIEWAVTKPFPYIGGVGSRAKAQRVRDRLLHKGFTEEACDRVRMPVGLDIGARLPEEIAVAIAAELVAYRRKTLQRR